MCKWIPDDVLVRSFPSIHHLIGPGVYCIFRNNQTVGKARARSHDFLGTICSSVSLLGSTWILVFYINMLDLYLDVFLPSSVRHLFRTELDNLKYDFRDPRF